MRIPAGLAQAVISLALLIGLTPSLNTALTTQIPKWRPNQSSARAEDYAGTAACLSCHRRITAKQLKSQMGRSMIPTTKTQGDHPLLTFQRGAYKYTLRLDGHASLTVEDGYGKITEPIFAVVGSGEIFQSYLIRHDGAPYRVAVDYLGREGKLDLDAEADPPVSLKTALGRRHSEKYVRSCLACHSPASVSGDEIDLLHRPFGNTCEVCHGPGAKHVADERAKHVIAKAANQTVDKEVYPPAIFNPGLLTVEEQSDFCGQCHTTASAMRAQNPNGVQGVISEPYRLEGSRCWNRADKRIRCTSCHNPHAPIVRDSAAYDSRCLACHVRTATAEAHPNRPGNACPVGKRDCASCHMPKVSVPDTPIVYSDHRIRIVEAGAPFPN